MAWVFVKPLVLFCPPEHYEALVSPILGPLFTYLHMVRDWSGTGNKVDSSDAWALMSPTSRELLQVLFPRSARMAV